MPEITAEEELHTFLKEVREGKQTKEMVKSITYSTIAENAGKSYEE